jgi:hypothetical protein
MATMREATSKLVQLKLIESVEGKKSFLDQDFLSYLVAELSIAIGPLGEMIVEDGLEDLGFQKNNFPVHRAAELVNLLAHEIQRDEKRTEFKQRMVKKIREKGY